LAGNPQQPPVRFSVVHSLFAEPIITMIASRELTVYAAKVLVADDVVAIEGNCSPVTTVQQIIRD
jgi:hypothetical protein